MKIAIDENLKFLAEKAGKPAKVVAETIVSELLQREITIDSMDFWGCTVFDSLVRDVSSKEFIEIAEKLNIHGDKNRVFEALNNLYLLGDHDCPECGGKMEVVECETKKTFQGYDTEYDVVTIYERKVCTNCKHEEIYGQD